MLPRFASFWPRFDRAWASAFDFPKAYDGIQYGAAMTDMGEEKDKGWQDWLARYGLLDSGLTEEQAYLRYKKFHKVKFPEVPES